MKIGQLNRRIKVKKPAAVVIDDAGGVSNGTIQIAFETFASVTPKNSNWLLMQGMQHLGNTYEITIRYSTAHVVDIESIIEYEGKDLKVTSRKEESEGRKRFLKLLCYEQEPSMGATGSVEPMECAGMENFTDVEYYSEDAQLVFSGGNLLGDTEGTITSYGVTGQFSMNAGSNTNGSQLTNIGDYLIRWRKKCGTVYTDYAEKTITITQEPNRYLRLFDITEPDRTVYQVINFPVNVYSVVMAGINEISITDTGLTAADEQEFMDIWNADPNNSLIGQLTTYEYAEVLYNGIMVNTCFFYLEINPNIHTPLFAWCRQV